MLAIRTMLSEEVGLAVRWAAAEGWNPGLHDAQIFASVDPEGFFIGEIDGEPVATMSAVRYGSDFAFLGFYIVKPEVRHRGIGHAIWRVALEHAGACTNVGLDGVLAQVPSYESDGFTLDYRNERYRGNGGSAPSNATAAIDERTIAGVLEYDRACFPAARYAFVRAWVSQPQAIARCVLDGQRVAGYGVMRKCFEGWKIGPLFADNAEIAQQIFDDLRAGADAGEPVFYDVPQIHDAAVAIAKRAGMQPVFETARMYLRGRPPFALERCFGVTSFELG